MLLRAAAHSCNKRLCFGWRVNTELFYDWIVSQVDSATTVLSSQLALPPPKGNSGLTGAIVIHLWTEREAFRSLTQTKREPIVFGAEI